MRRLIVSADDLGITRSVSEGILKAQREGIVTNVTLLPSGDVYEEAVRLAREQGIAEAGAHLALTETSPVSVHNKIPSLVGRGGHFRAGRAPFCRDLFARRIDLDHVYIELRSQLKLACKSGIRITSLSCHEHLHLLPALLEVFIKLAIEYDIAYIRVPRPEKMLPPVTWGMRYRNALLSALGTKAARMVQESGLKTTDHFVGLVVSGGMTEERLVAHIGALEEGTTELVTHPGFIGPEVVDTYRFHLNCEAELSALTGKRAKSALDAGKVALTTFGALEGR